MERSIEVIGGQLAAVQMLIEAMIVEGIRTKSIDETEFMVLLEQGMGAFQNNKNMSNQEAFGAIGMITSILDMIKRAKVLSQIFGQLVGWLSVDTVIQRG